MATRDEMAVSFGAAAAEYRAGRPEYPAEAVRWLIERVDPATGRIADVGAGTGKLTRAVIAAGASAVVAVDPDPVMLAALREELPDVPTMEGTAENLPFDDASLDAVILGQAWHWVEPVTGSLEVGRVVRAGGTLGLIWNIRDTSVEWVNRLTEIMHRSNAEILIDEGGPVVSDPFGELEQSSWSWTRAMTRDDLFSMARSRSYMITADVEERAAVEQRLHELFDELGVVDDATIDMPYVTTAFRARRN